MEAVIVMHNCTVLLFLMGILHVGSSIHMSDITEEGGLLRPGATTSRPALAPPSYAFANGAAASAGTPRDPLGSQH
eukprot:3834659-Amphidinium_carterae.1